ncbi:MAG TPA: sensor histidine kinase [Jatrophihabitantaceae bacterium]|nr:sensor histidine kinase [Jatrophihabitantaceae bacterium]
MTRRNWLFDGAIAAALVLIGQLEAWSGAFATHRESPYWAEALLYAATGALVAIRRVNPLLCLTAITGVSVVEFALAGSPEGFGVMMPAMIAAYSIARWETRRPTWWGLILIAILWLAWDGLDPADTTMHQHVTALVWISPWIIAWLIGALVRSQVQNLDQRRQARVQRAARAVAEERNRIARELHDVIGHSVSVMTVQASAVRRRLTSDQDVERQALETVEAVGREALGEMRRMVGVLRDAGVDPDREPPPGLAQLDRLVEKIRAAGLPVELTVTGDPRPLAPGLDLTAYRLIQEGLTNILRHAMSPHCAEVHITYDDDELQLAVYDDGIAQQPDAEAGHGLLGMRERVAVYGGQLVARPRTTQGFELLVTVPLDSA